MPRPTQRLWLCLAALAASTCGVDTDLAARLPAQAPEARAGGGGPLELVAPAPGEQEVPPNLVAIVLRAAAGGGSEGDPVEPHLLLRGPASAPLSLGALVAATCAEGGDDDGVGERGCYEAAVPAALAPSTTYALEVQAGELPARVLARFTTAAAADTTPPDPGEVIIGFAADCLRVRGAADAPVRAELVVRATSGELHAVGAIGAAAFDFATRLAGVPPGADATAEVLLRDLAGNRSSSTPVPLRVPPPGGALAITEVLANPAGAEGTQELVELRNLGDTPVALAGLVLEDDAAGDALPAGVLAPGGYALVLPADFVIGETGGDDDPPPREGTLLLRIAGRLGKDGLGPREGVRLRARDGAVLSSYGGWVDQGAAAWSGRSVQRRPPEGACDHPRAWTRNPRSPTPGW